MFFKKITDGNSRGITLSEILVSVILLLSTLGLADSAYLTISHYEGGGVVCNVLNECDLVLTSHYSEIFGIPVALFGLFYYLLILILSLCVSVTKSKYKKSKFSKVIFIASPVGLIASLYFVSLQLFVIKAICTYCMVSAAISTLIFAISIFELYKLKFDKKDNIQ